MALDFARYDELVHRIYDAALEPSHWPDALKGIADACDAARSAMFTPLHSPEQGGYAVVYDLPPIVVERWANKVRQDDPFAIAAFSRGLFLDGAAWNGDELVPHADLVRTAFYREIFEPMDVARVCAGVVFDAVDAHKVPTVITVYRPERDAPFAPMQVETLRRLILHVSRALGVMFHLRNSQFQVAATHAALDRLSSGVVLLNGRGGVEFCNSSALRQLQSQDILVLHTGGTAQGGDRLALVPRLQRYSAEFQSTLGDALSPLAAVPGHFSNALLLPDAHGKPICVVHAAPLGQASALAVGNSAPKAIVFIYDLAAVGKVPPTLLCELFGLTSAEARAAQQMLRGGTAEEIALRLGVSVNTVKSHLKAAYAKSGTHRQADFLKLLMALTVAAG
ncbi:helix-turn-helix transcriptional regulator [Rhodoferax sp.]|uniref:helix-turn-helix transcriptional regulator n=1 Tax=Rhodoferax sp. TaxID=50421 RepID=UPI0025EDF1D1|nr:helix-turn-helix transcriptional regulator [Rhodoferax sp.]